MATTNYHVPGQTAVGTSTALPNKRAFKLAIPTANGVLVVLDLARWRVRHTAKNSGGASTGDVFYAHGVTIPTADYTDNSGIKRASIPIASGADDEIQVKRDVQQSGDQQAVCFLAVGAEVVLSFRRIEGNFRNAE